LYIQEDEERNLIPSKKLGGAILEMLKIGESSYPNIIIMALPSSNKKIM
jgi:hypothetical protein